MLILNTCSVFGARLAGYWLTNSFCDDFLSASILYIGDTVPSKVHIATIKYMYT